MARLISATLSVLILSTITTATTAAFALNNRSETPRDHKRDEETERILQQDQQNTLNKLNTHFKQQQ